MPQQPHHATILLGRPTPAKTIAAAVYYAVALEDERNRTWPVYFYRAKREDGLFVVGQTSCRNAGKLQVRPAGGTLFDPETSYSTIEVVGAAPWPDVPCTCQSPLSWISARRVLDQFVESLGRVLKA